MNFSSQREHKRSQNHRENSCDQAKQKHNDPQATERDRAIQLREKSHDNTRRVPRAGS